MNILKPTVLLVLNAFLLAHSHAEIPKDILKKILKSTEEFKTYEITFNRYFKYPNEKDTLIETYQSSITQTESDIYIGWHVINYKRSGTPRSIAASNGSEVARLNYKDKIYYTQTIQDNSNKFKANLKSYLYQPILMGKEQYNTYSPQSETGEYYIYQKVDTTGSPNAKLFFITTSTLFVSKQSYLPVKEESISKRGANIQYSCFELINYKLIDKKIESKLSLQADSFLNVIKSYQNGDSIKSARKDLYRKIKIGDTVSMFKATTYDGKPFDLSNKIDSFIVLDFFYTTCSPCIKALPELNKIYTDLDSMGLTVVGVNAFSTDWDNLNHFVSHYKIPYDIVKTDKQVLYDYGVTGFPRMIIIRNGVVIKVYFGYAVGIEEDIKKILEQNKG